LQPILSAALANYSKQTGKDLQSDPLSTEIQRCKSPDDILNVLKKHAEKLDEGGDSKLMKYLNYIVNGLYALSTNAALSAGISLVGSSLLIPYSCILTAIVGFSACKYCLFWYQCPSRRGCLPCHVYYLFVTSGWIRLPRASRIVTIHSPMSLNVSKTSSCASRVIPDPRSNLLER
jgi:hypothetical protein